MSWWAFAPILLGLTLIAWGTGWLIRLEDALFPWTARQWLDAFQLPLNQTTCEWKFFLAGMPLAVLVATWWLARFWIGIVARWLIVQPPDLRRGFWLPMLFLLGLLLLMAYIILAGQVRRVGHEWAAAQLRARTDAQGWAAMVPPPVVMDWTSEQALLRRMFLDGRTLPERLVGLKMMVDQETNGAEQWLREVLPTVADPEAAAWGIRTLAMKWDLTDVPLMERFLDDVRPIVREAAIDGLGILALDYPGPVVLVRSGSPSGLACVPRIDLRSWVENSVLPGERDNSGDVPYSIKLSEKTRNRFADSLADGKTAGERQAAASVMVSCPPAGYRLRLAEWGVWMSDGGDLKMVQTELAGIPPFVHRTGNRIVEFKERDGPQSQVVLKPVIHLTVSQTMAVDLAVRIRFGRPWFAYPKPDDFEVAWGLPPVGSGMLVQGVPKLLRPLDAPNFGVLSGHHAGYPWLRPGYALTGNRDWRFKGDEHDILEVGLRWQRMIVSPEQLAWMRPPDVPPGQQYTWWTRLRRVNCSWVSSQNESERFLYYDGPTQLKARLGVTLVQDVVRFDTRAPDNRPWPEQVLGGEQQLRRTLRGGDPKPLPHGGALIVSVDRTGIKGAWIERADAGVSQPLSDLPLAGPVVESHLAAAIRRSLYADEAAAMIDCWRETFFAKPGLRVLLLLSAEEYDALCPLTIRPRPTERARVGIVWYELTPPGK